LPIANCPLPIEEPDPPFVSIRNPQSTIRNLKEYRRLRAPGTEPKSKPESLPPKLVNGSGLPSPIMEDCYGPH
jgi:hypothetical protein